MGNIEFHQVSKRFDSGQDALQDINVDFAAGSMCFLTGHSGAGKSTFLRLLLRLDQPTRGQILVNSVNVTQLSESRLPWFRRQIGVVFQDHHLLRARTVFENVALPMRVAGLKEREIERRTRAALDQVELLGKEHRHPHHLSTGEQQRIGIARAVVARPKILLADEPTGNLDPELSASIMDLFARFNQVGTTVIIATHDVDLISTMGCRILRLAAGRVVSDSPPTHVAAAQTEDPGVPPQPHAVDAADAV